MTAATRQLEPSPASSSKFGVEPTSRVLAIGKWYALATPLFGGVGTLPSVQLAGQALSGWIWVTLFPIGAMIVLVERGIRGPLPAGLPVRPWLIWLGLVWSSLAWCGGVGSRNIQDAMQLSMPLLVGVITSVYIRTEQDLRTLLKAFAWTLVPLTIVTIGTRMGVFVLPGDPELEGGGNRDVALLTALIGCTFIAGYPAQRLYPFLGWGACLLLILLTKSRMAAVTLASTLALHPLYTTRQRMLACGAALLFGVALFYSPMIQNRPGNPDGITWEDVRQGEIDTSGRTAIWPLVWDEAWKKPVLGAGIGTTTRFLREIFPDIAHPHNDYLRVGFELGLVGLAVWLVTIGWQMIDLWRCMRQATGVVRQTFAAALLGWAVLMMTAFTDNTLIYNLLYGDPLFALMGAAYGVSKAGNDGSLTR